MPRIASTNLKKNPVYLLVLHVKYVDRDEAYKLVGLYKNRGTATNAAKEWKKDYTRLKIDCTVHVLELNLESLGNLEVKYSMESTQ